MGGIGDYERASEGATLLHDAQWLVPPPGGSAEPSRESSWRVDGRGGGSAGAGGAGSEESGSAAGNPRSMAVPGLGLVEYDLATDWTELRSLAHRFVHAGALTSGSGCVDNVACVEAKFFAALHGASLEQREEYCDEFFAPPPKVIDAGGYSFSEYYGHGFNHCNWRLVLGNLQPPLHLARVLEIGVYEGRTATFMIELLAESRAGLGTPVSKRSYVGIDPGPQAVFEANVVRAAQEHGVDVSLYREFSSTGLPRLVLDEVSGGSANGANASPRHILPQPFARSRAGLAPPPQLERTKGPNTGNVHQKSGGNATLYGLQERFLSPTDPFFASSAPKVAEGHEYGFDLIYIDGDHSSEGVLLDGLLSWELLRPGGLLIFDDYDSFGVPIAVDAFVKMRAGELRVLWTSVQYIVRKHHTEPG